MPNWSALHHGDGPATDVPDRLARMGSAAPDDVEDVRECLGALGRGGAVYPATAAAVPLIVGGLAHAVPETRALALSVLALGVTGVGNAPGDPVVAEMRAALEPHVDVFSAWLGHADAGTRGFAALLVAWLRPGAAPADDPDPGVRALRVWAEAARDAAAAPHTHAARDAASAPHTHATRDADAARDATATAHAALDDPDDTVAWVAAACLVRADGDAAPAEALARLADGMASEESEELAERWAMPLDRWTLGVEAFERLPDGRERLLALAGAIEPRSRVYDALFRLAFPVVTRLADRAAAPAPALTPFRRRLLAATLAEPALWRGDRIASLGLLRYGLPLRRAEIAALLLSSSPPPAATA